MSRHAITRTIRDAESSAATRSLRGRLLLFTTALVLVPGILLALIAERSGSRSLERVIGGQLAREAGHTADRLSTVLRSERETLASFARQDVMREIRVGDIDKRIAVALMTLRDGSDARLDYLVIDGVGRVVAASEPGLLGSAPQWLPEPGGGRTEGAWISGPRALPGHGGTPLLMSTAIPDPDDRGRSLGTLVGVFDWQRLTDVMERVRADLAAQGAVADVLLTGPDQRVIGGSRAQGAEPLSGLFGFGDGPDPGFVVDSDAGLIIGRASLAADLPDWKLLVVEPRSNALAPARSLSQRLVLTMGLALVAALVLATIGARRVVQPLTELTRAIRGLPRGEAGARSVPVRSDDEVGTLAMAFNEMASELDEAQRHLVEAEKFAFVGELAAGVAHEIRTALGVLGSSAQMLQRSLPSEAGPQSAELAEMIRAEVGRLSDVVKDLLTLNRDRPLELEAVRVRELLARAIDFVGPQAREAGVRISAPAANGDTVLRCDPELVQQVAVNLLVNAIQALPPGGHVEVRILEAVEGLGGFGVWDDGPGIPDALKERVFQPFVTAREGGIGLGLTFVKRVVHDHRGLIELESEEGAGARFSVWLPLAEAER